MGVTIKDIATKANVSPSTVSRVISNSPLIGEKTKRKVKKVMEELGYFPNFHARVLVNGATCSLGIVMPVSMRDQDLVFQNPFFQDVMKGVGSFVHSKNYSLYMTSGETEEEIYQDVVNMVKGRRVDGILLLYSQEEDPIINFLVEHDFPFVLVGHPPDNVQNITYVDNDNYKIAQNVTKYLLSLGHEKIAFIGGNKRLIVTRNRLSGFLDTLSLAGLSVPEDYIKHTEFSIEGGNASVQELLELNEIPTAIFVTDDVLAMGVLNVLHEKKIRVPEQVTVVSFNNLFFAGFTIPPLTTVDVNIYQLGYEAAKCLVEKVEDTSATPKCIVVPSKLVVRKTCQHIGDQSLEKISSHLDFQIVVQ
ncbi:LacI family DNA-binding transcriptional regulator [Priestia koreensis]|uniref:LacI family DNA-binding transcriptional regulator n=1 Tax=Priestia koreensis TaxID=284581 RepID=UPI00203A77D6|nr:LacI family DNA-binding transcriptional regulator [Priestia koreensis]MCM3006019.1 LacI family transcriptional regulator [Priestia koreensis]